MPKQSRVTLAKLDEQIGLLVMALERVQGDVQDQINLLESRLFDKYNGLAAEFDSRIKTLEGALTIYVDTEIKQLNARVGSDFQDQDDEIEKISRRLQSVEDKLKAKQLGEQTNVELTARAKELQRQLTEAKHEIDRLTINGTRQPTVRVVDTLQLQCGRIIDADYVEELQELLALAQKSRDEEIMRADRVQRQLNETFEELEQLKFKAGTAPKPTYWFRKSK